VFTGFQTSFVDVGEAVLRVHHGGAGSPVLLLHGHPRTSATWSRVAPILAERHTVVCPDLRGYGQSSKPPSTPDHEPYSKRAMARDMLRLMESLGHHRFSVAGHDRGGYVAHRLAVDAPAAVVRLAVLDDVPIGEALARCDATFAAAWWHWFFLGQEGPTPERVITADPDAWYGERGHLAAAMEPAARSDLLAALRDPATVHAMCEDYRAGLTIDRANDEADRAAGRRVTCPLLVLWAGDELPGLYGDVVAAWRGWADDVRGGRLESGHHVAEEVPEELAARLLSFFGGTL